MNRRSFIKQTFAGMVGTCCYTWKTANAAAASQAVSFGVSTDIHKDIMPDADKRLKAFIDDMATRDLDYIIDLGDFCIPKKENQGFRDLFHSYDGPTYHVLGNHENDGGYHWRETMAFYDMEKPYYSFDVKGYHFVVLDGNNKHKDAAPGYPRYISPKQLKWLEADLKNTTLPTFVFSHQSLHDAGSGNVENFAEVQAVLYRAGGKVKACFCGHRHVDLHKEEAGIHYLTLNSMSYYWVGSKCQHVRYDEATEKKFPNVSKTIPYDTPLYTVVTLHPDGRLHLEGRQGNFVAPGPEALGVPGTASAGTPLSVSISTRTISLDNS